MQQLPNDLIMKHYGMTALNRDILMEANTRLTEQLQKLQEEIKLLKEKAEKGGE